MQDRERITIEEAIAAGIALHRQGRMEDAARVYQDVLDTDADNPDALHFLGVLQHQRGDSAAGVALIRRAIDREPTHADMRSNLGNVLMQMGRYDDAVDAYRKAIELAPEHADAHCNLGVVLRSQNELQQAGESLRKAVELDAHHVQANLNLGQVYGDQGQWERAIEHLRLVTQLDGAGGAGRVAVRQLANALRRAGRMEEAVAVLRGWREREPENAVARHLLSAYTGEEVPARASDGYVRELFDHFASSFDAVLASLHYRAPKLVAERFERFARERGGDLEVLDAACGTGLMGELLRASVSRLVGVDLSPGMLARARNRGIYDELLETELTEYLSSSPSRFDAVTCVDSFVYFGDLEEVVRASRRVLKTGGLLCFTLERCRATDGVEDYALQAHGRYRHRSSYVERLLEAAGYVDVRVENVIARMESGEPVPSLLVSAHAPLEG
jgi:predicted TPR repeat methyltransferase